MLPADDCKDLILESQGDGVAFAFDGLDEYKPYYYFKRGEGFEHIHGSSMQAEDSEDDEHDEEETTCPL